MIDTKYLRGSDGTGSAVLAHVSVNRLAGATTLKVDNVDNWPPFFIATSGKLNPAGYIIESTKKEFRGHLQGVDIIIDGFEPGFTDEGNTTDQVVILKQTTGWANRTQDALEELQGVVQTDLPRQFSETSVNFVVSGGIWSLVSGLNGTMTAIVAYINGYRNTVSAVVSRAFTASKDTYVDVLRNTTTGAFSLVYTEVAVGAASPALAANSIRLGKVTSTGSALTVFTQTGIDSLWNKYRPNDPDKPVISLVNTMNQVTLGVTPLALATVAIPPLGRKMSIEINAVFEFNYIGSAIEAYAEIVQNGVRKAINYHNSVAGDYFQTVTIPLIIETEGGESIAFRAGRTTGSGGFCDDRSRYTIKVLGAA